MYLHNVRAFNTAIQNFIIRYMLSGMETNSPENYATALYEFYNKQRLAEKLIPNPFQLGSTIYYTVHDSYALSYQPRKAPDGRFVIIREHITDSVQGVLKANYGRARRVAEAYHCIWTNNRGQWSG